MKDLQVIQNQIAQWSSKTFGNNKERKIGIANHLIEEAKEVLDAVNKFELSPANIFHDDEETLGQMADCMILLLDLASKFNVSTLDLMKAICHKMEINEKREWEGPDEYGCYHHKG